MTTTAADETATTPAGRAPLLVVENLKKHYPITSGILFRHQIGAVRAVIGRLVRRTRST